MEECKCYRRPVVFVGGDSANAINNSKWSSSNISDTMKVGTIGISNLVSFVKNSDSYGYHYATIEDAILAEGEKLPNPNGMPQLIVVTGEFESAQIHYFKAAPYDIAFVSNPNVITKIGAIDIHGANNLTVYAIETKESIFDMPCESIELTCCKVSTISTNSMDGFPVGFPANGVSFDCVEFDNSITVMSIGNNDYSNFTHINFNGAVRTDGEVSMTKSMIGAIENELSFEKRDVRLSVSSVLMNRKNISSLRLEDSLFNDMSNDAPTTIEKHSSIYNRAS